MDHTATHDIVLLVEFSVGPINSVNTVCIQHFFKLFIFAVNALHLYDVWPMCRVWPVPTVHRQYIPLSRRLQRTVLTSCISRVPLRRRMSYEEMLRHFTTLRHTCRWHPVPFIISLLHQAVLSPASLSRVHLPLPCRYFPPAVRKRSNRSTELRVVKTTVYGLDILVRLYKYTYLPTSGNSARLG